MKAHTYCHSRTYETNRLQCIIDAQRKQISHDAEIKAQLADELAAVRAELDDAVRAGSVFATALRWSMPYSPPALLESYGVGMSE